VLDGLLQMACCRLAADEHHSRSACRAGGEAVDYSGIGWNPTDVGCVDFGRKFRPQAV